MIQEDKARAYDEAIKRGLDYIRKTPSTEIVTRQDIFEAIFPQFKESEDEDEKLRKSLINYVYYNGNAGDFTKKEFITWIEKQGEKKYTQRDIDDAYLKGIADVKREVEKIDEQTEKMKKEIAEFIFNSKEDIKQRYEWIKCLGFDVKFSNEEKQGEQKPTDKVEPKFKVGDWICRCCGKIYHILDIVNGQYYVEDFNGEREYIYITNGDIYRLWTIQDVKAGDLLADDYGIYIFDRFDEYDKKCFLCMGAYQYSQKVYEDEHMLCSVEVHPATKEQRELLFSKMKETGYEWDAEKKESKKIEENPSWNEEDTKMLSSCIGAIWAADYYVYEDKQDMVKWLNHLKERCEINKETV